jgi:uncharacterized protein (TIGR02246 family)
MISSTTTAPTVEDTTTDHVRDAAAIEQVIADVQSGFNTNDPELSVRHFLANASAVNVVGVQLTGWDALLDANRVGLAGALRDEHARYEVNDIVFLRPDVAIAHKRAWATDPDGEPIDVDHTMVALYVFVREAGRWWIAARQNTLVPAAEAPG